MMYHLSAHDMNPRVDNTDCEFQLQILSVLKLVTEFTSQLAEKRMREDIFDLYNDINESDQEVLAGAYNMLTKTCTGALCRRLHCTICYLLAM
ncbi:hypothetical protein TNCV_1825631 [Trichonephila clavipes]|nr:hypothetical protein TNCV_1825631 [Trichonephila clavipes]